YAARSPASYSGCTKNNYTAKNTVTLDPGVYCNGINFNAGAVVTMKPGVYYTDRGDFTVNGGATITGTGVTIVLTSSNNKNYASLTINGGATTGLTAPTTGDMKGIVFFGDRNAPLGTSYKFNGGASQKFGGALYLPKG